MAWTAYRLNIFILNVARSTREYDVTSVILYEMMKAISKKTPQSREKYKEARVEGDPRPNIAAKVGNKAESIWRNDLNGHQIGT